MARKSFKPRPATSKSLNYVDLLEEKHVGSQEETTTEKSLATKKPKKSEKVTVSKTKQGKSKRTSAKKSVEIFTTRLTPETIEKIKDYVYKVKCTGRFNYTQGEAVTEGLMLLFGKQEIPPRPESER